MREIMIAFTEHEDDNVTSTLAGYARSLAEEGLGAGWVGRLQPSAHCAEMVARPPGQGLVALFFFGHGSPKGPADQDGQLLALNELPEEPFLALTTCHSIEAVENSGFQGPVLGYRGKLMVLIREPYISMARQTVLAGVHRLLAGSALAGACRQQARAYRELARTLFLRSDIGAKVAASFMDMNEAAVNFRGDGKADLPVG